MSFHYGLYLIGMLISHHNHQYLITIIIISPDHHGHHQHPHHQLQSFLHFFKRQKSYESWSTQMSIVLLFPMFFPLQTFSGSFDSDTIVKNLLYDGTTGQYLRIAPISHYGTATCLRTELYGIQQTGGKGNSGSHTLSHLYIRQKET